MVELDPADQFNMLEAEEAALQFDVFRRSDALALGLKIVELASDYPLPVAVEITVNGLVVFRHFTDGSLADSELWLDRKRRTVNMFSMSSLRFKYRLEMYKQTLEDKKLDPHEYAAGGGGFPVVLRETGLIGSICVSGMAHLDDHKIIVDAIRSHLGS